MPIDSKITEVPYVNITSNRIVHYTQLEGYNKKKRRPKFHLLGVSPPSPLTPEQPIELSDLFAFSAFLTGKRDLSEKELQNLNEVKYKGVLSLRAKKRLSTCVNWLYCLSKEKKVLVPDIGKRVKFRISMLTITLSAPQMHSDSFVKKEMLNKLLEKLRYHCGMRAYIWRAEIQTKCTNNIHFHITTNVYVHHKDLRRYWNDIQSSYGYIDAFEASHGHRDPNSTDVHSIYKIKNLAAYLCKYMAKECEGRKIEGRQWFLSTALSKLKPITTIFECNVRYEIEVFVKANKLTWVDIKDANDTVRAHVLFANIFTADLSRYPTLSGLKEGFLFEYQDLVN